jgi:hypothetical protein
VAGDQTSVAPVLLDVSSKPVGVESLPRLGGATMTATELEVAVEVPGGGDGRLEQPTSAQRASPSDDARRVARRDKRDDAFTAPRSPS